MMYRFAELAEHLRHGREIEFFYNKRNYSITNHSGYWHLCDDTAHVLLQTLCRFEEKELLVEKTAAFCLEGKRIADIFDEQLYEPGSCTSCSDTALY